MSSQEHSNHLSAIEYWRESAAERQIFTSITRLGFVRVSSISLDFLSGQDAVRAATQMYDSWIKDPNVHFENEPGAIWGIFADFVTGGYVLSKTSTDAYLAAFAIAGGYRLVSFDQDFSRFPGLQFLHLRK